MLYQLSYEPQTAGAVGLEPTTFEVEARHSIQLSYAPMFFVNGRWRDLNLQESFTRASCYQLHHTCIFGSGGRS